MNNEKGETVPFLSEPFLLFVCQFNYVFKNPIRKALLIIFLLTVFRFFIAAIRCKRATRTRISAGIFALFSSVKIPHGRRGK